MKFSRMEKCQHVPAGKYIYIYIFGENTLGECRINILKIERRKISKDEVQQDGKNANTSQPGIEPGTPADAAGALPTELPGPGPKPNQNE